MERTCETCERTYQAKLRTSRFCCDVCRVKAHKAGRRNPKAKPADLRRPVAPSPSVDEPPEVGSVTGAAIAELDAAGALGSAAGLAAVRLAQLIDAASLMAGSSAAAWVREMRAALADAKAGAPQTEEDPLDELVRRREARGA